MLLIDVLKEKFQIEEPILIEEIYDLYPGITRVDVYKMIKNSIDKGELVCFEQGLYYFPYEDRRLTIEEIIHNKFVQCNNEIRGIYSGYNLLRCFGFVSLTPNIIEIIKNCQTVKARQMSFGGYTVILKRSRTMINKDNYAAYTLLELFSYIRRLKDITEKAGEKIKEFISQTELTKNKLNEVAVYFPSLPYNRIRAFDYYKYLK